MLLPNDAEFVCIDHFDESLYQEALQWVDERKRVAFLSFSDKKSDDPRVQIYSLDSPLQQDFWIKKMAWASVQRKLCAIGTKAFQEKLQQYQLAAELILSEASDFCVKILKNAKANHTPHKAGIQLKGAFANTPAVIVGAGPSLEKQKHLLTQFRDKALVFAGGAALNVIDVKPHFAASIDPDAPHERFSQNRFLDVPFCYQSRMSHQNFSKILGEKIRFPDSFSQAINWIYEEEPFDSGWTVGNFLMAVADYLGCTPIYLVGMDYCYKEGKKYAELTEKGEESLIQVKNRWTQKDWLMAAQWTHEFSANRTVIDTSFEGILDLPKKNLEEALKSCSSQKNLSKKVSQVLAALESKETLQRWDEWNASLHRLKKGGEFFEEEIVYQKLLFPLWQIWQSIFEREVAVDPNQKIELHRALFFQKVLQEHE